MQEFAADFYNSPAWRRMRETIMTRDRYLCVECMKQGIYKPAEIVHHIEHLTSSNITNADITLNPSNLESVCRECHEAIHAGEKKNGVRNYHAGRKPTRRYIVDAAGNVIAR